MGNEASMEGDGQPGEPGAAVMMPGGPTTGPGEGQHMKPVNGTAAGGGMGVGGPGMGMTRNSGHILGLIRAAVGEKSIEQRPIHHYITETQRADDSFSSLP
ncbi:hypothetical protein KUCAC02_012404 [Chaenocephalus aceratus]|uniref:Uncharacterized protein n=1 Tax=Chaenocephalus aceratus TaxID=36190 RepID=A0ACB9XB46_CHAAC|nr:hypothetical protein KUCAC02_012404 [Chaenocephalus aceratus]